jgi:hypothetical protein
VQLDLAGAVNEVEERGAAGAAPRREASGDTMDLLGLLAVGQVRVGGEERLDRLDAREAVRERAGV